MMYVWSVCACCMYDYMYAVVYVEVVMNNKFKRSVCNGVKEITTGDMTDGETTHAVCGVAVATGGVIAALLGSKVAMVVGAVMVGGAVGKAFTRGFSEQWNSLSNR